MNRCRTALEALTGFALGAVVLGLAAPRQSRPELHLLGRWATWSTAPLRSLPLTVKHPQAAVVTAVLCLVAYWLLVAWRLARGPAGSGRFRLTVIAWVAPFALGAPTFSRDLYSYVAQGELVRRGLDPYVHPVAALGRHSSVLAAADPTWRSSLTPYGPLALRVEHLAAVVGADHELWALVALRLVSLACLLGAVVLVRRAVRPDRRDLATWLVCSPLVLVHGVAPAHLDLAVGVLLLWAAVLAQRGRLIPSSVLVVLAGEIKATAFIALVVLVVHAFRLGRAPLLRTLAAAGLALVGSCLLYVPDPLGWASALSTPTSHWNPYTPSSVLLLAVGEARHHADELGPSGLGMTLKVLTALVGAAAALWLLMRSARTAGARIGIVMLVALMSAPVLWPWYLLPCAALLLLGEAGDWSLSAAIGAGAALMAMPIHVVPAQRVAVVAAAAATGCWLVSRRSTSAR